MFALLSLLALEPGGTPQDPRAATPVRPRAPRAKP